jgi:hypothetical protein
MTPTRPAGQPAHTTTALICFLLGAVAPASLVAWLLVAH